MARDRMNYSVNPHWQFLLDHYGMEEAFSAFGPYAGASIQPRLKDKYTYEVTMPLVRSNTNYVGTHFGGSLYSMCDPFYMFILMENLGPDYIVWDKSAQIEFVSPGTGTVSATFHIPPETIDEIRSIVAREKKTTRFFETEVTNEDGKTVARLKKELYVRRKPKSA